MTTADPQRHRVMKVSRRQALRLMGGAGAAARNSSQVSGLLAGS
jgi:hypothetical protein